MIPSENDSARDHSASRRSVCTLTHAALTDTGRVRVENQDRWFADDKQGLFIVSDGVGGHSAGGLAAHIVVRILPPLLRKRMDRIEDLATKKAGIQLKAALAESSRSVRDATRGKAGLAGMGATIVLALVRENEALVAHLGDSRAYLFRGGRLEQLTRDHSIIQELLNSGEITAEQAATHPARGHLSQCVGMPGEAMPAVRCVELQAGDRLLLCTDGLTGMLSDDELVSILKRKLTAKQACKQLIATANRAGGRDNITALLLAVSKRVSATRSSPRSRSSSGLIRAKAKHRLQPSAARVESAGNHGTSRS